MASPPWLQVFSQQVYTMFVKQYNLYWHEFSFFKIITLLNAFTPQDSVEKFTDL